MAMTTGINDDDFEFTTASRLRACAAVALSGCGATGTTGSGSGAGSSTATAESPQQFLARLEAATSEADSVSMKISGDLMRGSGKARLTDDPATASTSTPMTAPPT